MTLANDGQAMRDGLAMGAYDAVVLDIGLPGAESGLALAQVAAEQGCSVVLITGHHHLREELAHSGHRFLLKPFRVEALLRAIEEAREKTRTGSRRGGKAAT